MIDARMDTYNNFHIQAKVQKRVIDSKNFTYRNVICVLDRYLKKGNQVLDIGCGVGTLDFYMARKGINVVGLDISKFAISVAKQSSILLKLDEETEFYVSDFPKRKIKDKFDLIVASETLEHIPNDINCLKTMGDFLKNNGLILISVPLATAPLYRLGLLKSFDKEVGHLRRYNEETIVGLIQKSGFRVVYKEKFEGIVRNTLFTNKNCGFLIRFIRGYVSDLVNYFDHLSISIFGASQLILIAKK